MNSIIGSLQSGASIQQVNDALAAQPMLNMLNTKYVIYSPDQPALHNLNTLGSAWFIDEITYVESADAEITAMKGLNAAKKAIAHRSAEQLLGMAAADPSASISLDQYETNHLSYSSNSASDGVAVFSEIWYGPDWQAYIDGSPVDHARVNYVLRGLRVPAGNHTIEFRIESTPYRVGSTVNVIASAGLILLVLGLLFKEFRSSADDS